MSAATVISLEGVTRRFDTVTAVDDLSLDLREAEFFALLGPSGCGKTTLLRMIAGFEQPDQGRILLDGRDMTRLSPNRRPVNLMFQSYALFPHMSVAANVSYGLEMEKLPASEIRARTGEILERTQLGDLAGRKPHQLSGGQRQRVALARALVKRPRVLLLDEPLGALDKKLREQMQLELKRLQHDSGITFVVVTHDQDEALVMADRIALMRDGRIAQLADPVTLYEAPANRFVAGFIGVTNLIAGRATSGGINVPGTGVFMADGDVPAGAECALSVRPERITVSRNRPEGAVNALAGTVTDIAYHGQDIGLAVTVPGLDQPISARLTAGAEDAAHFTAGREVWLTWQPAHGRLLAD